MQCAALVAVTDDACYHCGRRWPSLWGFYPALRGLGPDLGFVWLVTIACVLLFGSSLLLGLVAGLEPPGATGFLQVLAPSTEVLFLLGATGSIPVFEYGRWWTVLSSAWLHGGLLHIVFNMLWIRLLAPGVAQAYGPGRLVIIYTLAAVAGGVATTLVSGYLPGLPGPLRGASLSIGASGAVFGLLGAVVHYGKRAGGHPAGQQAWVLAAVLFVFGLLMPGVDNWGHLGGFVGGYGAAWMLDPRRPERGRHVLVAIGFLVLSALSIVVSVVHVLAASPDAG